MGKNTFLVFGILAVLIVGMGIVSASITFYPAELTANVQQGHTATITFKIHNNETTNLTNLDYSYESLVSGSNTLSTEQKLTNLQTTIESGKNSSEITYSVSIPSNQATGVYEGNLTIRGKLNGSDQYYNLPVKLNITRTPASSQYDFCGVNGTVGDLRLSDITFSNMGEGEDEDWYLLDNVEIEVEVENMNNNNPVRNVVAEIEILNSNGDDVTGDFGFTDDRINLNTIRDGDSKYATFKIPEVPADLESGAYKAYIKAYSDSEEAQQCVAKSPEMDREYYQRIEVTRENDPSVIVKQATPKISASCGDKNIELPLSIYNLGSDKERSVLVAVTNSELGINKKILVEDLRSGKKKDVIFFLNIPEQLQKSSYTLNIKTYYDYNHGEDKMSELSYGENSYDDLDKTFSTRLDILSCQSPAPTVIAELNSKSVVGTNMVIKATVTNNGYDNNFVISASDYEGWANLVSITPQSASIKGNGTEDVIITLAPTVAGTHSFNINTIVDGKLYKQSVSITVAEKPGLFNWVTDKINGTNNEAVYIIAGLVGILILLFLIVIVTARRTARRPQF